LGLGARYIVLALASGGGVGFLPYKIVPFKKWKGGGLLGSLVGLLGVWLCGPGTPLCLAVGVAVLLLSVPVSGAAEKLLGSHDDPRIVIDEVAGVWIAAWGVPAAAVPLALAFFFFRFFDVLKGPWGRWAARAPGGWGVVADDVLAGVLANLCVRLII
jgi:phosphatidylglycerophosphatase A